MTEIDDARLRPRPPQHRRATSASRASFRRVLPIAVTALVLAVMAVAQPALAQERARDYVQPRIIRAQYTTVCQAIGLDSNQRQIAGIIFDDYESSMEDLTRRLDDEAIKAGRATVDDSLSGKARVAADELKRLRVTVLTVYLQAGPEVDVAIDTLMGGLEALLMEEQLPKFNDAMRTLRRDIMLHPRANGASYQEYAGDGVDVLELVREARAEGSELAAIDDEALAGILQNYESSLDQVLLETYAAERQGRITRKIASINKDTDVIKREEQAALKRWQRLYQLNQGAVDQIADYVAQAVGKDAAEHFAQRFDRESFTWLYPRRKPDRQIEWLRQQATLPPDTLAKAEDIYSKYIQRRDGLSRSAIDLMLKARLEFQTMLYAMIDPASIDESVRKGLYEDLLKNTGEQSHLESSTSSQLEALLDEPTRQALREAMKRPDRVPPRTPTSGR